MTLDSVRKLWHAEPFRPFTVHLADGQRLDVIHPDFMAVSPSGREATIYVDRLAHQIDLRLVTSLSNEQGQISA